LSGWRFADREWFVNDGLNLRTDANRRMVAGELEFPNVVFGAHRWFAGGGSADLIAITSLDQWDADLARGRPGDNVIVLSLRRVEAEALRRAGDMSSPQPPPVPSEADVNAIGAYIAAGGNELLFVRRFSPRPAVIESSFKWIDLEDAARPWQHALAEHSIDGGEVWLFDGELLWRDHDRRQLGADPPETWTAHHGIYVLDGHVPDEQGRVVCGGPY
jgi:hypothetical protein